MKRLDIFSHSTQALRGLGKGELLRLDGRPGLRITSRRGTLWLTQDGDPNDVVLTSGESHEYAEAGPVLVEALDAACVSVDPAPQQQPWWARWRIVPQPAPAIGGAA